MHIFVDTTEDYLTLSPTVPSCKYCVIALCGRLLDENIPPPVRQARIGLPLIRYRPIKRSYCPFPLSEKPHTRSLIHPVSHLLVTL